MSEYTAEDFAKAHFAIDPSVLGFGQNWVRCMDGGHAWHNPCSGKWTNARGMAQAGRIPVYAEPYSPEALQRAWEHGEKPGQDERATEGLVTILNRDGDPLSLIVNAEGDDLLPAERIVYRPPVPEPDPVDDLTTVLCGWHDRFQPKELAEFLHKHGVRVVADDE